MAIRRYCHFQFCIKVGEGFQGGISFWLNGKRVGSIKKENKITFPDQYIWSHFLKVGKTLNQTVPRSPCSRGGSPVWNSHTAGEASTPPPSPCVRLDRLCKLVCGAHGPHTAATVRTCGFRAQGGSGFALLPPEPGVHLSELAYEQVIYNRPKH